MKLLWQSIMLTIVFTVLTGVLYPLVVTGIAQVAFHDHANGSLLMRDGKVVGSELLAQQFTGDKYFWPRPSAGSYATVPSGASNLGPTSQALQSNVAANAAAFRTATSWRRTRPCRRTWSLPPPADLIRISVPKRRGYRSDALPRRAAWARTRSRHSWRSSSSRRSGGFLAKRA